MAESRARILAAAMLEYQVYCERVRPDVTSAVAALSRAVLGGLDEEEFAWNLENQHSLSLWTCTADQELVGYKMGFQRSRTKYYSWLGAVSQDWRRQGIARELMRRQHQWATARGFTRIETRTMNRWKPMLILNLRVGFDIIGIQEGGERGPKLILEKDLR